MKVSVIKKYTNRKFYDTERSSYVTLNDLYNDVRQGRTFIVVDVSSDKPRDITTQTLLRAVVDKESEKENSFTPEFLFSVIQSQDGTLSGFINKEK